MNDSEKLRVVQVGCGKRGQIHIKPMLVSGVIDLVALCDLDAGRLQAAGEQFGMIKLGSRTELLFPREVGLEIRCRLGQKIKAGSTVLAAFEGERRS